MPDETKDDKKGHFKRKRSPEKSSRKRRKGMERENEDKNEKESKDEVKDELINKHEMDNAGKEDEGNCIKRKEIGLQKTSEKLTKYDSKTEQSSNGRKKPTVGFFVNNLCICLNSYLVFNDLCFSKLNLIDSFLDQGISRNDQHAFRVGNVMRNLILWI